MGFKRYIIRTLEPPYEQWAVSTEGDVHDAVLTFVRRYGLFLDDTDLLKGKFRADDIWYWINKI